MLRELFRDIDIYFFDQLLKGRVVPGMRILDAGCGYGRNVAYLLKQGFEVHGVDLDPFAVAEARLSGGSFHVGAVEAMPFPDEFADVVISSAVLHFARDDDHFSAMLRDSWRVLKPGGLFFCRLASSIGLIGHTQIEGRRYLLPDGSERYLVDEAMLDEYAIELGAEMVDPLKTSVVRGLRSMTTWVLRKR